jgi:hypothetical protein
MVIVKLAVGGFNRPMLQHFLSEADNRFERRLAVPVSLPLFTGIASVP